MNHYNNCSLYHDGYFSEEIERFIESEAGRAIPPQIQMRATYSALPINQKVKFTGTRPFWFQDLIENGNKLKLGAIYTIKTKKSLSSWTKITLEETGDNVFYNLSWFEEI